MCFCVEKNCTKYFACGEKKRQISGMELPGQIKRKFQDDITAFQTQFSIVVCCDNKNNDNEEHQKRIANEMYDLARMQASRVVLPQPLGPRRA